ncbi:MAG TPA: hypothetical protein VFL55_04140 [Acetobacteraceae bacterium]|nr:hypothetical protein [Acetobacteraceae bacterium]
MSSEARRGLRIALCFTAAFVLAELVRLDLQLTFIAPLVAGSLATGPAARVPQLVALPIIAWLLVAVAGYLLQFLADEPLVFCLFGLWVFYLGFRILADPHKATIGLVLLLVFAIVPQTLIKGPELASDLAYWFGLNFSIAAFCDWATRLVLPDRVPFTPAFRPPSVAPLVAAAALLVAVILTATMQPPAPGAVMVGIIIVLRADGESAGSVIRDRFVAACLGGASAVIVWEVLWLAPSLPVLATVVLLAAWPFAAWVAMGGPGAGMAMKSLNVLAILLGEGFSVFYQDADDRVWTRLAGVALGLSYVALVISLNQRITERRSGPLLRAA